jgi:hypothetical protein
MEEGEAHTINLITNNKTHQATDTIGEIGWKKQRPDSHSLLWLLLLADC